MAWVAALAPPSAGTMGDTSPDCLPGTTWQALSEAHVGPSSSAGAMGDAVQKQLLTPDTT